MIKEQKNIPTEAELEILQILWEHGSSTVRYINEMLNERREVGYTSTLKTMQIMLEKNLLLSDKSAKTHIYTAKVNETLTQKKLLDKFVNAAFRGSAMKLVSQALGGHETSAEELIEIKALIEKIEQSKK